MSAHERHSTCVYVYVLARARRFDKKKLRAFIRVVWFSKQRPNSEQRCHRRIRAPKSGIPTKNVQNKTYICSLSEIGQRHSQHKVFDTNKYITNLIRNIDEIDNVTHTHEIRKTEPKCFVNERDKGIAFIRQFLSRSYANVRVRGWRAHRGTHTFKHWTCLCTFFGALFLFYW